LRRRSDLVIGIVLGVVLGIAIVAVFVFVFSEQTIDDAELDPGPAREQPAER
jgi:hypothetical protein